MVQAIAKRTFLLRQEDLPGGKRKDVIAKRGEKIQLSEKEAIKFWGGLELKESDKKMLLNISKSQKVNRVI